MRFSPTEIYALLACVTFDNPCANCCDLAGIARGDSELWCYQCNADLSQGRKAECNDPYSPAPNGDLVACPRNDSYVCLKSLIFYRNVHVTVRGCVPSTERSTYCSFKEAYPEASLECLFCDDYACNASHKESASFLDRHIMIAATIILFISSEYLRFLA